MNNLEGALLSDYLLVERISQGAMADVYRAQQRDEDQYEVAVKMFQPLYAAQPAFRLFFMREAEKIGLFDHPSILPFIEYGEGEQLLYSVTPFVKSGTLNQLLKRVGGKFSPMQALPIIQQLCDAVQYAHERAVIHGNIRPGNIFVANDGRMLLADFGLAHYAEQGPLNAGSITWNQAEYAAPEQSLGILRPTCDVYALGVLLFRLLTGSSLFTGQTPVEIILKHVREEPRSVRELEPIVSEPVADVLYLALRKRAEDRYPTAREFGQAFAAAVALAPVASPVARELPPAPRLSPPTVSLPPFEQSQPLPAQQQSLPVIQVPHRPSAQPVLPPADQTAAIQLSPAFLNDLKPPVQRQPVSVPQEEWPVEWWQEPEEQDISAIPTRPPLTEEKPVSVRPVPPVSPAPQQNPPPSRTIATPSRSLPVELDVSEIPTRPATNSPRPQPQPLLLPEAPRSLTGKVPSQASAAIVINRASSTPVRPSSPTAKAGDSARQPAAAAKSGFASARSSVPATLKPASQTVAPVQDTEEREKRKLWLPILVVIFLILGLLGALLSSFFLPPAHPSGHAGFLIPPVHLLVWFATCLP